MRKMIAVLVIIAMAVVGMAGAANYMYEKASVKGVGYKNVEMIISTQTGFEGQKLVEKESGSGNVITERTELEAERQLQRGGVPIGSVWVEPDGLPRQDQITRWTIGTDDHVRIPDRHKLPHGLHQLHQGS